MEADYELLREIFSVPAGPRRKSRPKRGPGVKTLQSIIGNQLMVSDDGSTLEIWTVTGHVMTGIGHCRVYDYDAGSRAEAASELIADVAEMDIVLCCEEDCDYCRPQTTAPCEAPACEAWGKNT